VFRKVFFFEKKKQKAFVGLSRSQRGRPGLWGFKKQRFFASFFKKEALPCLPPGHEQVFVSQAQPIR
jgi:hypothetical protein